MLKTMLTTANENRQPMTYIWNMSISVHPFNAHSLTIASEDYLCEKQGTNRIFRRLRT